MAAPKKSKKHTKKAKKSKKKQKPQASKQASKQTHAKQPPLPTFANTTLAPLSVHSGACNPVSAAACAGMVMHPVMTHCGGSVPMHAMRCVPRQQPRCLRPALRRTQCQAKLPAVGLNQH
jgi:hypothetical protein